MVTYFIGFTIIIAFAAFKKTAVDADVPFFSLVDIFCPTFHGVYVLSDLSLVYVLSGFTMVQCSGHIPALAHIDDPRLSSSALTDRTVLSEVLVPAERAAVNRMVRLQNRPSGF